MAAGRLKFNFVLSADAQAGDQVDDLRDQIEDLGHTFAVARDGFLPPPWFNIFSEGTSEATPARLGALAAAGYHLVALVTEQPTLVTAEGLIWNYQTDNVNWMARAEIFVEFAPSLCAAWCYAPGAASSIKRFVPAAVDIDMGWGCRFLKATDRVDAPANDFCFFGATTPRRNRIIDILRRRGHTVDVIPHSSTLAARDARIQHSRVVLDIKQHHWWDLASSVRYSTALLCGRPVVAEHRSRRAMGDWASIVRFAEDDAEFPRLAAAVLSRWRREHALQLSALRLKPGTLAPAIAALPEPLDGPTAAVAAAAPANGHRHRAPPATDQPHLLDSVCGTNLVAWSGVILAVPQALGAVHIDKIDLARYPSIKVFESEAAARETIR